MPWFTCPDCKTLVDHHAPVVPGNCVRCYQCGALFIPEPAEEDLPTDAPEKLEPNPFKKEKKKRRRPWKRVVLWSGLGLGVGLLALGAILFLWTDWGRGLLGLNTKVSFENAKKVWVGMPRKEVQDLLGEGTPCTLSEWVDYCVSQFGEWRAMQCLPDGLNVDSWRRYRNGNVYLIVGFRKGKSGVERAAVVKGLRMLPGDVFESAPLLVSHPMTDLDRAAEDHAKNERLLREPRWKTGSAVRQALMGSWHFPWDQTPEWEFNLDGSCAKHNSFAPGQKAQGTYRFTDDTHIAIHLMEPNVFPGGPQFTPANYTYRVLVDDNSLIFVQEYPSGPVPLGELVRMK